MARKGCAYGRTRGGDFVLGLEGLDVEVAVPRDLVEDVARRCNGIGAEEDRAVELHARCDDTHGERRVAGDISVYAWLDLGFRHYEGNGEEFGRLAECVTRAQRPQIGVQHFVLELGRQPLFYVLGRSVIEPTQQAECEEVLAAVHFALTQRHTLQCRSVERRDGDLDQPESLVEVGARILVVARLRERLRREGVAVDDDHARRPHVVDVGAKCSGIESDEQVDFVRRRVDAVCGEVDLEARHAGQGSGRSANLCRVVWKGREIVAR